MQYFDIYIDSTKGIYTYSDKNDEFEIGDNVIAVSYTHLTLPTSDLV